MRDWVTNVGDTYYLLGSVLGPHPYPLMVREFQSVIGLEARAQIVELAGTLPAAIVACVGGGSNAMGMFDAFIDDRDVRLIGVEAGGEQISRGRHAARFAGGSAGVLQGTRTFVLQDEDGNIELTHSISAGLDYAAVGPEHAWLRGIGRAEYAHVTRRRGAAGVSDAGGARRDSPRARIGACHCLRAEARAASSGRRRCCSSICRARGDKDVQSVEKALAAQERIDDGIAHRRRVPAHPRRRREAGLVTYTTAGDPDLARSGEILQALDRAGADVLEVGVPFSDPLADGPVIQRATERALAAGGSLRTTLALVERIRPRVSAPIVVFSYANPLLRMGRGAVCEDGGGGRRGRGARARSADRRGGRVPRNARGLRS